jgi:hypothetical protein
VYNLSHNCPVILHLLKIECSGEYLDPEERARLEFGANCNRPLARILCKQKPQFKYFKRNEIKWKDSSAGI